MSALINKELPFLRGLLRGSLAYFVFDQWDFQALLKTSFLSAIACSKTLVVTFILMEVDHQRLACGPRHHDNRDLDPENPIQFGMIDVSGLTWPAAMIIPLKHARMNPCPPR